MFNTLQWPDFNFAASGIENTDLHAFQPPSIDPSVLGAVDNTTFATNVFADLQNYPFSKPATPDPSLHLGASRPHTGNDLDVSLNQSATPFDRSQQGTTLTMNIVLPPSLDHRFVLFLGSYMIPLI